jgi:hypothetical protein
LLVVREKLLELKTTRTTQTTRRTRQTNPNNPNNPPNNSNKPEQVTRATRIKNHSVSVRVSQGTVQPDINATKELENEHVHDSRS